MRILLLALLSFPLMIQAQMLYPSSFPVTENGQPLSNPYAGGLNQPQFSSIDLNGDTALDLFVFDRSSNSVLTFLNTGSSNIETAWSSAPQYASDFPDLHDWVLLRDYNCDNKVDIFTASEGFGYVVVHTNTSTNGVLSFSPATLPLKASGDSVYVASSDIPAIDDIDGDGDMDILSFDVQGFFVVYYKNLSQELYNDCTHLEFEVASECWGTFREEGLNNDIFLNTSCKTGRSGIQTVRHAGSTLATYDQDYDGDKELLIGDISFNNIVYLHNGGDAETALMDTYAPNFPVDDVAVNVTTFPAAYYFDMNNDGNKDLVVSGSSPSVSGNFHNIWMYQNHGTPNNHDFQKETDAFLQSTMIDCGSAARPLFFDYDADGLLDILIGNDKYKTTASDDYSDLTLYKNTGTATAPAFSLITREYLGLKQVFKNPPVSSVHPALGDLDGDGDLDLILGDFNGNLHYFENKAASGAAAQFELISQNYAGIDVGAMSMPTLYDLDKDGDLDLVIGEQMGNLNYFPNSGSSSNPVFSTAPLTAILGGIDVATLCCGGYSAPYFMQDAGGQTHLLLGTEYGVIWEYNDIDNNLSGNFQQVTLTFGGIEAGRRSTISAADITGDGQKEYIIGNMLGGIHIYQTNSTQSVELPHYNDGSFALVPNPAHTRTVEIVAKARLIPEKITVYRIDGQIIGTFAAPFEAFTLPKDAAPGVYFVHIQLPTQQSHILKWVFLGEK